MRAMTDSSALISDLNFVTLRTSLWRFLQRGVSQEVVVEAVVGQLFQLQQCLSHPLCHRLCHCGFESLKNIFMVDFLWLSLCKSCQHWELQMPELNRMRRIVQVDVS